jgi:hypothetical protein
VSDKLKMWLIKANGSFDDYDSFCKKYDEEENKLKNDSMGLLMY